ncbi:hypothetical protein [Pedobacter sp. CG_S7]|uniref:hypothetical protein n=1 Tax=Pedobacter sp. CG_S7 TaxID=3143930 RepID=UPI003391F301
MSLFGNRTTIKPLIISLIGVSIFNVLPIVFPNTSVFSYVLVFLFTVYFFFEIYHSNKFQRTIETNIFYKALLIWTIIIILRGLENNYNFFRGVFVSPYLLLPYLFPFFIKSFKIYDFKIILSFIHYMNVIFLSFLFLYFIQPNSNITTSLGFVEDLSKYFAFPNFFLLFSIKKAKGHERVLSVIVFIIGFLIVVYCARRSLIWTYGWAFLLALILNIFLTKQSASNKILYILITVFFVFILFVGIQKYKDVLFENLIVKIDADTRGAVISDFESDMDPVSLLFGRGISGGYLLKKTSLEINNYESKYRTIIEAGYLNLILKGGYFYLFLIFVIYLISIYKGLFKSNNTYNKAFACFILVHLVESYPAGILTFNLRFFLIWYCISMCWNKKVLNATDSQVNNELQILY